MGLSVVSQSRTQPVTLAEAKEHVEILSTETGHDAKLRGFILAATRKAEAYCQRQWHVSKCKLTMDRFPLSEGGYGGYWDWRAITVPRPPLLAVESIVYNADDGTETTLAASLYRVDAESEPARIVPAYNETWPGTRWITNAVTVTYWCGYANVVAAAASDILTPANQHFQNGDIITLDAYGASGAIAAGLDSLTTYHAIEATATTLKLSATSGGDAVDVTGAGTATQAINDPPPQVKQAILLTVGNWFENRESVAMQSAVELPQSAKWLLDGLKTGAYPGTYALVN